MEQYAYNSTEKCVYIPSSLYYLYVYKRLSVLVYVNEFIL